MAFPPSGSSVLDSLVGSGSLNTGSWSNDPLHFGGSLARTATGAQAGSGGYGAAWWNTLFGAGVFVVVTIAVRPANGSGNGVWLDAIQQPSASASTADGYQAELLFNTTDSVKLWKYTNVASTALTASINLPTNIAPGDQLGLEVLVDGHVNIYTKQSGVWTQRITFADTGTTYFGNQLYAGFEVFDAARAARVVDFSAGSISSTITVGSSVVQPSTVFALRAGSIIQRSSVLSVRTATLIQPSALFNLRSASLLQPSAIRSLVASSLIQQGLISSLRGGSLQQPTTIYQAVTGSLSQTAKLYLVSGTDLVQLGTVYSLVGSSLSQRSGIFGSVGTSLGQPSNIFVLLGSGLAQPAFIRLSAGAYLAQPSLVLGLRNGSLVQSSQLLGISGSALNQPSVIRTVVGQNLTQRSNIRVVKTGSLTMISLVLTEDLVAYIHFDSPLSGIILPQFNEGDILTSSFGGVASTYEGTGLVIESATDGTLR